VQQIERDCFSVAKRRSIYIYTTLAFLALLGAPYIYIYIYDISSLRVNGASVRSGTGPPRSRSLKIILSYTSNSVGHMWTSVQSKTEAST